MKHYKKKSPATYFFLISLLSSILFPACSPNTVPIQKDISNADMIITSAQQSTATENAPLELRLAKEKLEQARTALDSENYTTASYLAQEAMVTANLAYEKTRTEKTKEIVRGLRESINTLNEEILNIQKSSQGGN
ncbi:MAG: DUF4398 domain-containing protein [Syntrophales bacterium]|jgi:ATP phosphoribosyltransferase|nr:DUF4398 domain-containing protein [Syntrophales bacterium]MDY0044133.1 DUF4398 domain-containing protein [Syntrophales bacterium]